MKNINVIIAAVFMLAGCTQQLEQPEDMQAPIFTASFEDAPMKTYLDSGHKLLWTADDRLSIFINTYNQQYRYTGESGKTSADFEEVKVPGFHSGNTLSTNYSVYPYKADTEIANDGTITVNLPAVQAHADNSFGLGANTMVAVTSAPDDYFLPFKNLCGYLVVKLYGEGTVKSVTLKGNDGEGIAGKATVVAGYDEEPQVTMSETASDSITVDCGEAGIVLAAAADSATEFWFCIPPVTFSQGFTVTVTDVNGKTFEKGVSSSKTITRNIINALSALEVSLSSNSTVPEMVNLGLPSGLKWASFNVGATCPEECGDYYAWGETETKSVYDMTNCKWRSGDYPYSYLKYNTDPSLGAVDNKLTLDLEDDVAHVKYGSGWRLPTEAEFKELFVNCVSRWTTLNGMNGREFTSKINGNSIFLPAAGCYRGDALPVVGQYGYYLSSSLHPLAGLGNGLGFGSSEVDRHAFQRECGYSVRPVFGDYIEATAVSFDRTDLQLYPQTRDRLVAVFSPSTCSDQGLIWSSSDPSVADVTNDGIVHASSEGTTIITAVWPGDTRIKATCTVTVTAYEEEPDQEVDLTQTNYIGVAVWHDVFAKTVFNLDGSSYDLDLPVDVYEDRDKPGLFYFDSPYNYANIASWFGVTPEEIKPYTDCWKPVIITIDARNPNDVNFPLQELGCCLNPDYGWLSGCQSAPTRGGYFNNIYGVYSNGRIVFDDTVSAVTEHCPGYDYGLIYHAQDAFIIDMPESQNYGSIYPELVDLGLPSGIKWGSCNLGANCPEKFGNYYAWGEKEMKTAYYWGEYRWGGWISLSKYNSEMFGTLDDKYTLDSDDDAVHALLGGNWRIPTEEEFNELIDNCYIEWTTLNGTNGCKFTSKTNGRSIFLPAAGHRYGLDLIDAGSDGCYWTSSLSTESSRCAIELHFHSDSVSVLNCERCHGMSIRPVSE